MEFVTAFLILLIFLTETFGRDVRPVKEKYLPDYSFYHNLSRIQSHLVELASEYPNYVKLDWLYLSKEQRPQFLLRITNFTDSRQSEVNRAQTYSKVKILFSYGEHAREFLPIENMFHVLENLTTGLNHPQGGPSEAYSRFVLSNVELFMVAMVNPDGRWYIERTGNYCWRGTSTGVDLNRNFDWSFGNKGSSDQKDNEEYRGTHAFSEPECSVLTDITSRYKFDAFLSLHSGIRQIYVPYADSISKEKHIKPDNLPAMLELADRMSHATPHEYKYGLAYQLNDYSADGTAFDYMAGVRKIPFSFAIELWGEGDHKGARCFDLFNPPSQQLQAELEEIHPIYDVLFRYIIEWKQTELAHTQNPVEEAPSLTFGYLLLLFVIILTLFMAIQSRLPPCLRIYPRRRVVSLRSLSSTFSIMTHLQL